MGNDEFSKDLTWTIKLEEHFAATGERAHCLSWAHKKSEELYSTRRTYIDLPVIVLSSVTGFCSVGQGVIFEGQDKLSSILLGVISLFVGILNTTGSYFGWAKRTEAHRISAIHYARLYRFVKMELSLPREERMKPTELLKYCKDQYERLAEISPLIPIGVVDQFKKNFSKYQFEVTFPEEMNGLDPIEIFDVEFESAMKQGGDVARNAELQYKERKRSMIREFNSSPATPKKKGTRAIPSSPSIFVENPMKKEPPVEKILPKVVKEEVKEEEKLEIVVPSETS